MEEKEKERPEDGQEGVPPKRPSLDEYDERSINESEEEASKQGPRAEENVPLKSQDGGGEEEKRKTPGVPGRGQHKRSVSHGGGHQPLPSASAKPLPSVLKKTSTHAQNRAIGHRRVFSHGQIPYDQTVAAGSGGEQAPPAAAAMTAKGHKRTGSKTEFILPPGHEERERKRSAAAAAAHALQRSS